MSIRAEKPKYPKANRYLLGLLLISAAVFAFGIEAKGADLFHVVKEVDPDMLFPIHTEHPEMFVRATRKMSVVEEGREYALDGIRKQVLSQGHVLASFLRYRVRTIFYIILSTDLYERWLL